jgi:hypothetical protein
MTEQWKFICLHHILITQRLNYKREYHSDQRYEMRVLHAFRMQVF